MLGVKVVMTWCFIVFYFYFNLIIHVLEHFGASICMYRYSYMYVCTSFPKGKVICRLELCLVALKICLVQLC